MSETAQDSKLNFRALVNSKPSLVGSFASFSVLIFSFVVLYYHVLEKLIHDWIKYENYSHGFLVPAICAYIVWKKRENVIRLSVRPANWAIVILMTGLSLFVLGNMAAELFTMRFSMLIVIWGLIAFIFGMSIAGRLWVAIGYLIFMIPIPTIVWNRIAFPLKMFVTKIAVHGMGLLGIPVYAEGNIIHLSNTSLQVVDACSGMRSLTSLLALSAAFSIISTHSLPRKWLLFLSAIPIAIFLNIVRLIATAILAQHFGPDIARGFLHELSGVLVFLSAIGLFYLFHLALAKISFI